MAYGILVAVGAVGAYQIIGEASTREEAIELARNYLAVGAEADCLAPEQFVVYRRDCDGWYIGRDILTEVL